MSEKEATAHLGLYLTRRPSRIASQSDVVLVQNQDGGLVASILISGATGERIATCDCEWTEDGPCLHVLVAAKTLYDGESITHIHS